MENLKRYLKQLIKDQSYRGWHVIQAEKTTHDSVTKALKSIVNLSDSRGIFTASDSNLEKVNERMSRAGGSGSPQTIRKQVLVNLTTLGFVTRSGQGQTQEVRVTENGEEYLAYEKKEFYFDELLSKFRIRVPKSLAPYPLLVQLLSDERISGKVSFEEFQYFVSQLYREEDLEHCIGLILQYRSLSDAMRRELDAFAKDECDRITTEAEKKKLSKEYKRDFGNWRNNTKHTIELFSLGSEVKYYKGSVYLLLGSDDLKREILSDLDQINRAPKTGRQKVHFRDQKIMQDLKKLYSYYCQFCGYNSDRIPTKNGFLVEAAHIKPVSEQEQYPGVDLNAPENIVIACPTHHAMIDKYYPPFKKELITFDDGRKGFVTVDGSFKLYLVLNEHF